MTESALHMPPRSRRLRRPRPEALFLAGAFVLFVVGMAGLIATTGWEETRASLSRLSLGMGAALLALSLANYALRGLRWHLYVRALGLPLGWSDSLRHYVGGFAMSVTPGRVGELVRMRWIRQATGRAPLETAPLAVADRAGDMIAMGLLLALAMAATTFGTLEGLAVAMLAIGAGYFVTRPRLAIGMVEGLYRRVQRKPRLFAKLRIAARQFRHVAGARVFLPALGLGLMGWFAEGVAMHLLLVWMGADIGLWTAVLIFTLATLAGGLTGAPGGLGGAEAAMVGLLSLQGVPLDIGLPATAIIRLTTLWFAVGLGLIVFPFAELKGARA